MPTTHSLPVTALTSTVLLTTGFQMAHGEQKSEFARVESARRDSVFFRKGYTGLTISFLGTLDSHLTKVNNHQSLFFSFLLNVHSARYLFIRIKKPDVVLALKEFTINQYPSKKVVSSSSLAGCSSCKYHLKRYSLREVFPATLSKAALLFLVMCHHITLHNTYYNL